MPRRFSEKNSFLFVLMLLLTAGCHDGNKVSDDYYLLRIGENIVSGKDYLDALEVMKASYPFEALQDEQVIKSLKTRLLKELTEELIISERAEELGLSVSSDELKQAIDAVKKDYPDDAFEKILLERAIPLRAWEKRIEMRLLTEKVIDKDLIAMIKLTPEDVTEQYRSFHGGDGKEVGRLPEKIDPAFVKYLRREKAQQQFPQWIETLQRQYKIEFNEQRWKTILG